MSTNRNLNRKRQSSPGKDSVQEFDQQDRRELSAIRQAQKNSYTQENRVLIERLIHHVRAI